MADENKTQEKKGLELLDDETLARIVVNDFEENSELKSLEAQIAFRELARRSGETVPKIY